jgi:hypothetical protein
MSDNDIKWFVGCWELAQRDEAWWRWWKLSLFTVGTGCSSFFPDAAFAAASSTVTDAFFSLFHTPKWEAICFSVNWSHGFGKSA